MGVGAVVLVGVVGAYLYSVVYLQQVMVGRFAKHEVCQHTPYEKDYYPNPCTQYTWVVGEQIGVCVYSVPAYLMGLGVVGFILYCVVQWLDEMATSCCYWLLGGAGEKKASAENTAVPLEGEGVPVAEAEVVVVAAEVRMEEKSKVVEVV